MKERVYQTLPEIESWEMEPARNPTGIRLVERREPENDV